MAIQLAKHLGAHVATTVGPASIGLAKDLGADIAIDYRNDAFEQRLSGYDVVLHTLGNDVLHKSLRVLKPGAKLISISGPPDPAFASTIGAGCLVRQALRLASFSIRTQARQRGVDYSFLFMRADGKQLAGIADLVEAGAIRPVMDRVFDFEDTPAALQRVASGHVHGKVVVQVASGGHGQGATS